MQEDVVPCPTEGGGRAAVLVVQSAVFDLDALGRTRRARGGHQVGQVPGARRGPVGQLQVHRLVPGLGIEPRQTKRVPMARIVGDHQHTARGLHQLLAAPDGIRRVQGHVVVATLPNAKQRGDLVEAAGKQHRNRAGPGKPRLQCREALAHAIGGSNQLAVSQLFAVQHQGNRVRVRLAHGLDRRQASRGRRPRQPGPRPLLESHPLRPLAQEASRRVRSLRRREQSVQQLHPALEPGCDGAPIEELGGVLHLHGQGALFALADQHVPVELGPSGVRFDHTNVETRHHQGVLRFVGKVEANAKERQGAKSTGRVLAELGGQHVQPDALVLVHEAHGLLGLGDQPIEIVRRLDAEANGERGHKEAHEVLDLGQGATREYRADDEVALARQLNEQRTKGGQQRVVEARPRLLGVGPNSLGNGGWNVSHHHGSGPRRNSRPRPRGGQLQGIRQGRRPGQVLAPRLELLLVHRKLGVMGRVVTKLNRQIQQAGIPGIEGAELTCEDPEGPAVTEHVVHHKEQGPVVRA